MKIVVYFETGVSANVVAHFASEKIYMACLPALEKMAEDRGMFITESVRDDEELTDEFEEG
jgi:ornithine carbamoyltransferase